MTAWTRLARRARDDRGSLPMALLISLIGMMLSAALVPVLLTQFHSSRFDSTRVQSLDAAQAGIDVTLGQIRAATSSGNGDATQLPCGPVTGTVDGAGTVGYSVAVQYYTSDPTANPGATPMSCVNGYGTFQSSTGNVTPAWAKLTAKGTSGDGQSGGGSSGRTLVTTYQFKTNNFNIAGGVIRIFPGSSTSSPLCLDAGSATPTIGTVIQLQACSTTTPAAAKQLFVYRTDLTIQLLATVTSASPNGDCLAYANENSGTSVTVAACSALGSPPYTQQWSFDDSGAFHASTSTTATSGKGALAGTCMDVAAQAAGTSATLQSCINSTTSARQAWIPAPSVGAGAAIAPQWVNYYEFGRCIDVTGQDVNTTYLIDYPCKQNPYAGAVAWNQKFTAPTLASGAVSVTGQFSTVAANGTTYCLTSPLSDSGLVTVKPCSATRTDQTWTISGNDDSLPYKMKFTVVDSSNRCLGLTTPQGGMVWSAIDVEPCVGRADQKWNAAPTTSTVLNTTEK